MFQGVNHINVDAKGRLALPTRYRESVHARCQSEMVITAHQYDRCLVLYPRPDWLDVASKVSRLPDGHQQVRNLKRRFIGQATEFEMDGAGRLLLPPALREFAELEKKVVLIGLNNKFELWAESAWRANQDISMDVDAESMPDDVKSLSF